MIALFWCSRCKTETIHRKQDDGSWTCSVCGHNVSAENAEIAIVYREKSGPPLYELEDSHKFRSGDE